MGIEIGSDMLRGQGEVIEWKQKKVSPVRPSKSRSKRSLLFKSQNRAELDWRAGGQVGWLLR